MWLFQRQAAAAKAKAKAKAAKRRARRKRKQRKAPYDPAKARRHVASPGQIDNLVALAKGKVPISEGLWFYKQFIAFSHGMAKNPEHVKEYLEKAYWVEEEDIRQQIQIILWIGHRDNAVIGDEYYKLAQLLRVYLIRDEKIFRSDKSHLQAMYQYDLELSKMEDPVQPARNLDIVIEHNDALSTFDRYVIYLCDCLGKTGQQLSETLLLSLRGAMNIKQALDSKIKTTEEMNGSKNTERYSQPTLTVFTNR